MAFSGGQLSVVWGRGEARKLLKHIPWPVQVQAVLKGLEAVPYLS